MPCSLTSTTTSSRCRAISPVPVGLPLLKETHLSHLGKLMFEWFYWHSLLPGRDILGVHRAMRLAGKVRVTETKEKETPS